MTNLHLFRQSCAHIDKIETHTHLVADKRPRDLIWFQWGKRKFNCSRGNWADLQVSRSRPQCRLSCGKSVWISVFAAFCVFVTCGHLDEDKCSRNMVVDTKADGYHISAIESDQWLWKMFMRWAYNTLQSISLNLVWWLLSVESIYRSNTNIAHRYKYITNDIRRNRLKTCIVSPWSRKW